MKKKILCAALAAALLYACAVPASAAGLATYGDLYEAFGHHMSWPELYDKDPGAAIQVSDLLWALSKSGFAVSENGGSYAYPLGGSDFLSPGEWSLLGTNAAARLPKSSFREIVSRMDASSAYLDGVYYVSDADAFIDFVDRYFGEYSSFVDGQRDAAAYWMSANDGGIYHNDCVRLALHEMCHEYNARKSGMYVSRGINDKDWHVTWVVDKDAYYPRNPATGEFTEIAIRDLPRTADIVGEADVPAYVRESDLDGMYLSKGAMANENSVYGMLEELCATAIDVHVVAAMSSVGWRYEALTEDDMLQAWFWDGLMGSYLRGLREADPEAFEELMGDEAFTGVLSDALGYIWDQAGMVGLAPGTIDPEGTMRAWSEEAGAWALLSSLSEQ